MFLSPDTRRRLTFSRFLAPITVALAVVALTVNELGYQSLERLNQQRATILETLTIADQVRLTALMMESAQRGYILTERSVFLDPYMEMSRQVEPLLERVESLAQRYPEETDNLTALAEAARRKQSEMQEVLTRFESGNRQGAMDLTLTEIGRERTAHARDHPPGPAHAACA